MRIKSALFGEYINKKGHSKGILITKNFSLFNLGLRKGKIIKGSINMYLLIIKYHSMYEKKKS